jgi:ABC-type spermidine/putrescine transport system permease subunit II
MDTLLSAGWAREFPVRGQLLRTVVVFVYLFSLGPILITAAVSFKPDQPLVLPPRGFSLRGGSGRRPEWIDPLLFSLKLGSLTAAFSTLLALPLAFALFRYRFRGREALLR